MLDLPTLPPPNLDPQRRVLIGCSGYAYKHWRGVFYPEKLPSTRWLEHYAKYFSTVELNNTFYTLPSPKTFDGWREKSPPGFIYAVKASRFITHMKKLKDPHEPLATLFERATLLGPKLGPVLYQLPPNWRVNLERLENFFHALPGGIRHTLEVRDPSWLIEPVFDLLREHKVAFCITSLPIYETPVIATADFVYIRFHGSRTMYYYDYPSDELRYWADTIRDFVAQGLTVYAYFDNDPEGWAVSNAMELRQMLGI